MAKKVEMSPDLLRRLREKYGDKSMAVGVPIAAPKRIATGILEFDVATGGGLPQGHISIVWGEKDTGKSTLLYKTIETYLRENPDRMAALQDLEGNYDSEYGARQIGIDESRLIHMVPDCAEDGGNMIHELIEGAPEVGLIAVDSLAAFMPIKEVEKELDEAVVGTSGLFISRFLRRTTNDLLKARKRGHYPTIFCINQVRTKIGAMGDPSVQPGGKAPGFYASTIVRLWGGKEAVENEHDPNKAVAKEVRGVIEKKKGQIVGRNFEYKVAIVPHAGLRVGESDDWKFASFHMLESGQLGKTEDEKAWQILGHGFPTKKACREWYEANRAECRAAIIGHLMDNPEQV